MEQALIAIIALAVGAIGAHWLSRTALAARGTELESERRKLAEKAEALARAEAERDAKQEQLDQIVADRETIRESFEAISAKQLKENRDELMKQAKERFEKDEVRHKSELEKRHLAIETQFKGVNDSLEKFKELQREVEEARTSDFGMLKQRLTTLHEQTENLGKSTTGLSTALRGSSQSRGKWGEMALRNIVEAAHMTEHCDFTEQTADDSGSRPDLIVKLPGDARIPIDAKVPYADYERMVEEQDPAERAKHLKKHGDTVRHTMIDLAKRKYHEGLGSEIDFTVMFIPIESVAAAAFEACPDLQAEAIENRILITTPVTLIALLRTVGLYWTQETLANNAKEIWEAASELHKRMGTFSTHLSKVGGGLRSAIDGYNAAVGSYETRVLPQGRKIEELSGGAKKLPETLGHIETQAREVAVLPAGEDRDED